MYISNTLEVTSRLDIARAVGSTGDMDVVEGEVRTTAIPAKDIVISGFWLCRTGDVGHGDIFDDNTIGGASCRAAVEVVLLDIDAVYADV